MMGVFTGIASHEAGTALRRAEYGWNALDKSLSSGMFPGFMQDAEGVYRQSGHDRFFPVFRVQCEGGKVSQRGEGVPSR